MRNAVRPVLAAAAVATSFAAAACGSASSSGGTAPPPVAHSVTITAGRGPSTANPSVNGAFVNVTVCVPGSATQCTTVTNVLLDTGSTGLRVLSSALGDLALTNLTSGGLTVANCIQYVDLTYNWGPVALADVRMAGEVAAATPIQVIAEPGSAFPAAPASCANGGHASDTVDTLSANGILGVSTYVYDCGSACAPGTRSNAGLYYSCSGAACQVATAPLTSQIQNPVARFATDNNGLAVTLPALPDAGAPFATGTLTFGIGTQRDNALGGAVVQTLDARGNFTTVYGGASYSSSFVDSGSNAVFFLDSATTGLPLCLTSPGFYCPATMQHLSATNSGANAQSKAVSFTVANVNTLPAANWVFDDVAGNSSAGEQSGLPSLYFDWGLSFFFGRTVFVAFEGRSTPGGVGPYWAY